MKRNIFTRLLHRGRKLLRGRRRKAGQLTPSFLRLETLEDRRLLAAGFGSAFLLGRLAPVTLEISIQQQPTVVSPASASFASSILNSEQSLFSFLLGSSEGASFTSINNSTASSPGLVSDLVTPVNSTVNSLLTPVNSTVNNLVTPVTSAVTTGARTTQPLFTTTTNVVPNLLFVGSQTSQPPLLAVPSVSASLTAPISVPTAIRTSTAISPSANAGSSPVSLAIPPVLPPSLDVPSTPVDSVPVAPPAQPDAAPSMPTVPTVEPTVQPVVSGPLENAATSSTPIQMSVVTPAMTPETPPIAPPTLDNTPPSSLPVQTSLAVPPVVPPPAVPATTDTPLAVSEMAIAQTAEVDPAKEPTLDFAALLPNTNSNPASVGNVAPISQAIDAPLSAQVPAASQLNPSLAAAAIGGGVFTDLEMYVFPDAGDPSVEPNMPADPSAVPLTIGEHNDVTPPQPGCETAAPLSSASDEVFTQVAYQTAQKVTAAAKELLTPSSEHWMRYVAPIFIAAGAYFGVRVANRKKTNERRPALNLAN